MLDLSLRFWRGRSDVRSMFTISPVTTSLDSNSSQIFSLSSSPSPIILPRFFAVLFSSRHLIADHLGWFTDSADEPRNIEQIVAAHGGRVRRGVALSDGEGGETLEIEGAEEISYETVEKKTRDDA